ncbi:MAG: alpha/beta hydrolase [Actinomycetaceae bacterium]|nr:alpha/beta hydrolase [Actinomycetaceae bacterium]
MALNVTTRDIDRVGTRPTALFLHAYPLDHRMWEPVIDRLDGVPLMVVDAPGFGGSESFLDTPSLESYADQIASVVGRYGVEKVVPIGCSLGGYVALALAQRHPRIVSGIGMIASKADADSDEGRIKRIETLVGMLAGRRLELMEPAIESMFSAVTLRNNPELVQQVKDWGAEASREGLIWAQRAMSVRPDRLEVLEELGLPGLVMRGEDDTFVTPEQASRMAAALGTQVVEVRSAGHLLPLEDPGAVSRYVMTLYLKCK